MRKAFSWTYESLSQGGTLADLATREAGRLTRTVMAALDHLNALTDFDHTAFGPPHQVIGLDEVGRGPLAGPLVACCVQLPYPAAVELPFLRDAKKLQADEREFLVQRIEQCAVQIGYGVVEAHEFGKELNLHQLTFLAMQRAVEQVDVPVHRFGLLVDGKFPLPQWTGLQKAVVKGDDTSLSVAAASVLAKVYRDRRMKELHERYPMYDFARHVGYGTDFHRQAILEHGPCPEHRSNFLVKILTGSQ